MKEKEWEQRVIQSFLNFSNEMIHPIIATDRLIQPCESRNEIWYLKILGIDFNVHFLKEIEFASYPGKNRSPPHISNT